MKNRYFISSLLITLSLILCLLPNSVAQVAMNSDGSSPDISAGLDVQFTNKGFLPPRMTEVQRDAILSPAAGLIIYCSDWSELQIYNGTDWVVVTVSPAKPPCGEPLVDARDSQSYTTVQIGSQCWMASNLNIGMKIDVGGDQTDNATIERYCYGNNTANCDVYGGLYQWDEMMQYVTSEGAQGICPDGWHLPSDAEWMILEEEAESTTGINWTIGGLRGTDVGGNLKETGFTHWLSPNYGATNSSGFTCLPGGFWASSVSFQYLTTRGKFWSSTYFGLYAMYRELFHNSRQVKMGLTPKEEGLSVRCVRD